MVLPERLGTWLVVSLLGLPADTTLKDNQLLDGVGEFANMVCGAWLSKANETASFTLEMPKVTRLPAGWAPDSTPHGRRAGLPHRGRERDAPRGPGALRSEVRCAGKKILLADDSRTALMIERALLVGSPYDVIVATDGYDAVQQAVEAGPDLIILDVVMPNMDGFEACRQLRSLDATRDTPIIMVTTRGEPHNVESGYELGCNDYVTKPINGPELLSKVRTCSGTKHMRAIDGIEPADALDALREALRENERLTDRSLAAEQQVGDLGDALRGGQQPPRRHRVRTRWWRPSARLSRT